MKKINLLLLIVVFLLSFVIFKYENEKTNIEIYTPENIYYIDGLKLTNEADEKIIIFKTAKELKDHISMITSESSINCIQNSKY